MTRSEKIRMGETLKRLCYRLEALAARTRLGLGDDEANALNCAKRDCNAVAESYFRASEKD